METTNALNMNLFAEIQLHYRPLQPQQDRPVANNSRDAYQVFLSAWDHDRIELCEDLKLLLLDNRGRAIGIVHLSSGGTNATVVYCRMVFAAAIKANASAIILAHNHPSGNLSPSVQDSNMTDKLLQGGKILDIQLFDHLIISPDGYYSYADQGLL